MALKYVVLVLTILIFLIMTLNTDSIYTAVTMVKCGLIIEHLQF